IEIALFGGGRGALLRVCAPLAAPFDEAEAPRAFRRPIRRLGRKLEVDEVGAAARRSGMARAPDSAVSGEMGEELQHRDFGAVFRGEPGEAIGALPRAAPASDANDDVGEERMSAPGMKEHNANIWTREGADGRLCQPRALAIEALRAEMRERLRSRERSPCKARERPASHM